MKKYPNKRLNFTHFASLPFIRNTHRQAIKAIQDETRSSLVKIIDQNKLRPASNMLMHLTLSMLNLPNSQIQAKAVGIFQLFGKEFSQQLKHTILSFSKVGYFTRFSHDTKEEEVTVIYLYPDNNAELQRVKNFIDKLIRKMIQVHIVRHQDLNQMNIFFNKETGKFQNQQNHLTLFRLESGVPHNEIFKQIIQSYTQKMTPLSLECDFIDISTRFKYDQTKFYTPLARVRVQSLP